MAPMNWLKLLMLFESNFMLINMISYYNFLPSTPKPKNLTKFITKPMNWKW